MSPDGSSGVDLNRAGVPLAEIVSAPDLRSVDEVIAYLEALRAVLMYLGVNDGHLEEGSFRCDANVSVRRWGDPELGQRCELKNMNSFRYLRQAIDFEVRRQVEVIEGGGAVRQETRLFDPARGETRAMRSKEDAHDYRYFPEPDLPPLAVDEALVEEVRRALPELPRARAARYRAELGLSAYDAGNLTGERATADYFEATLAAVGGGAEAAKRVANWVTGEGARLANESGLLASAWKVTPEKLAALLALVEKGTLSGAAAKSLFEELFRSGGDPGELVQARGLAQLSDEEALGAAVDRVLAAHPAEVARYRGGQAKLLGFFVGKAMRELGGKGNPAVLNRLLAERLG